MGLGTFFKCATVGDYAELKQAKKLAEEKGETFNEEEWLKNKKNQPKSSLPVKETEKAEIDAQKQDKKDTGKKSYNEKMNADLEKVGEGLKESGSELKKSFKELGQAFGELNKSVDDLTGHNEKQIKKQAEKQYQKDRIEQLKRDHIPYCPKCKSTNITFVNKKLSLGRAVVGGVIGAVTLNPLGAAAGATMSGLSSKKGKVKCLNCGHTWKI